MIKKILLLFLMMAMLVIPINVQAEQAAAEQYRKMFREGNFYVEYQAKENYQLSDKLLSRHNGSGKNTLPVFIAGQNGKRILGSISVDAIYQDGKYYRWIVTYKQPRDMLKGMRGFVKSIVKTYVLPENELNAPYLDPDEEWQYIRSDLALPDELAVFYWNDSYRENTKPEPKYNGSAKRTVDGKEYDCDQYISYIASLANTNIAMEAYNMLYQNDQLVKIQYYFIRDGKEYLIRTLDIKTIMSEVPERIFKMKKTKVLAASKGDMADLLEQDEQVGTIGGKSK